MNPSIHPSFEVTHTAYIMAFWVFISRLSPFYYRMPFVFPRRVCWRANRMLCKAVSASQSHKKQYSGVPLIHFSASRKKRCDPGNITDNALTGPIDEMRGNACTIVYSFSLFSLNRSFFSGTILFTKTAHISHGFATAQRLTLVQWTFFISSQSSLKGSWHGGTGWASRGWQQWKWHPRCVHLPWRHALRWVCLRTLHYVFEALRGQCGNCFYEAFVENVAAKNIVLFLKIKCSLVGLLFDVTLTFWQLNKLSHLRQDWINELCLQYVLPYVCMIFDPYKYISYYYSCFSVFCVVNNVLQYPDSRTTASRN